MTIQTHWWGVEFTPESEQDKETIKEMLKWEVTKGFEKGNIKIEDGKLIIER